jgi:hypothetical protein
MPYIFMINFNIIPSTRRSISGIVQSSFPTKLCIEVLTVLTHSYEIAFLSRVMLYVYNFYNGKVVMKQPKTQSFHFSYHGEKLVVFS